MKNVLIVDDSVVARMFIRRCLEIGWCPDAVFLEAGDGKAALAVLKENKADLVVSDLNMPVMDGELLLKWIRSSPKLHDVPVVIITSVGFSARARELLELGARAVMPKPVSPALLHETLVDVFKEVDDEDT